MSRSIKREHKSKGKTQLQPAANDKRRSDLKKEKKGKVLSKGATFGYYLRNIWKVCM